MHVAKPTIAATVEHTKTFGGILGLIALIYAGAATIGVNLPTPAWSSDIERIDLKLDEMSYFDLQDAYDNTKRKLREDRRSLKTATDIDYQQDLEEGIEDLNTRLKLLWLQIEQHKVHRHAIRILR